MNFMAWLSSLDELLYEVMSWILFLPVTLWRTLRHPLAMMDYADAELARPDEDSQYQDAVSPPLFLVLCILIAHALAIALGEGDALVASRRGLAGLVTDETTALLFRVVLFGSFALFMAARFVRKRGQPLTRATLKPPFYAQCYPVGVLALLVGGGAALVELRRLHLEEIGLATCLLALVTYGLVASLWFARGLGRSLWCGLLYASFGMVEGLAAAALLVGLVHP